MVDHGVEAGVGSEAVAQWGLEPACQSGPDVAAYPVLSPPAPGRGARGAECLPRDVPRRTPPEESAMDTIYATVAGLDVHQKFITVGVRCRLDTGKTFAEVRTYGTMTCDLLALADYLQALGVTHVALESTGVLWKPVWNLLDGRFQL